ncbi:MAG: hypothetical protein FRX49_09691 [Trebouxia sp. A1-2]|nr:MAG: hypothetical protein FRX49_09691 [Trebouxia sp. A1-2]
MSQPQVKEFAETKELVFHQLEGFLQLALPQRSRELLRQATCVVGGLTIPENYQVVLDEVIAIRAYPSLLQGLQCKLIEPAWWGFMEVITATVQPDTARQSLAKSKISAPTSSPCSHLDKDCHADRDRAT